MAVDYVAGKKNSLRTKREKAEWYEKTAQEYIAKSKAVREEVRKDEKLISTLENMIASRDRLVEDIATLKIRIAQPLGGGQTVDQIFDKIKEREEEIADLNSQIRALYYGK